MKKTTKITNKVTKKKLSGVAPYKASVKVLGNFYYSEGQTAGEAISKLAPPLGRGVAILTVEKGEKKQTRILNSRVTTGLFSLSRLMREINLKNVSLLFDF